MISSISFLGTYKVNNQNQDAFSKFQKYASKKRMENGVKTSSRDRIVERKFGDFYCISEQSLIVPDYMNADVETYCANNGINYKKYDTQELLNPESITSRIMSAPSGYKKVNVDVSKLNELSENQSNNFEHCRENYETHYSDVIDTIFRTGDKFPTSTLLIRNQSGNKNLKRDIKKGGIEGLKDNQVMTCFIRRTDDPTHCVYFALKDVGVDKVPVYVDDESYEAGTILGLFE